MQIDEKALREHLAPFWKRLCSVAEIPGIVAGVAGDELIAAILAYEAAKPAPASEAVAWVFELARAIYKDDRDPTNWGPPQLSFTRPSAGKHQRNVRPLYAAPAPAEPCPEAVAVKALEWVEQAGSSTTWRAESSFGRYLIYMQPDNSWAFESPFLFGGKVGFRSPNKAMAGAQADYETRIRSALATPAPAPAASGGLEAVREARISWATLTDWAGAFQQASVNSLRGSDTAGLRERARQCREAAAAALASPAATSIPAPAAEMVEAIETAIRRFEILAMNRNHTAVNPAVGAAELRAALAATASAKVEAEGQANA